MTRLFLLVMVGAIGCAHPTGVAPDTWTYASDTGEKCVQQCSEIGMGIATVVLMSGRVGCVCQPLPAPQAAAHEAARAPVDVLSIMEEEQAEQQVVQPR